MYFFLIFIVICSPLTFAFWPFDNNLQPISNEEEEKNCVGWLEFYGFKNDNYRNLVPTALSRNQELDMEVHWIAAGYVTRLSVDDPVRCPPVSPAEFCGRMGEVLPSYKFTALKNFKHNSCEAFIYIYGYSQDHIMYNKLVATSMKSNMGDHQSMFAVNYTKYLLENTKKNNNIPSEFCALLGKTNPGPYTMNMILWKDIQNVSCERMLRYFEYTDDLQHNYQKSLTILNNDNNFSKKYVPSVVRIYQAIVSGFGELNVKTIEEFCSILDIRGVIENLLRTLNIEM